MTLKNNKIITVRIYPDEYVRFTDRINHCEGKTFSDRFRAFMRDVVMEEGQ